MSRVINQMCIQCTFATLAIRRPTNIQRLSSILLFHSIGNHTCTLALIAQHAACFKSRKRGESEEREKNCGRPQSQIQLITQRILCTTLPSHKGSSPLSPSRFLPSVTVPLEDLMCGLCQNIVDQPIKTPCRKLVCSVCVTSLLRSCCLNHFPYPYCSVVHEITETSFPEATNIVMNVLGDLLVKCEEKNNSVLK